MAPAFDTAQHRAQVALVQATAVRMRLRPLADVEAINRVEVKVLAKLARKAHAAADATRPAPASDACPVCHKPTAFDADELTDGEHCICCLGDDCTAPSAFLLDGGEHYCEACGPAEVVRLIALPGPSHIDLVRLEAA